MPGGWRARTTSSDGIDLRAAGVQAFDLDADNKVVVFAVNTFKAWTTPELQEFDVFVDANGDGAPDFDIFDIDLGVVSGGDPNGQMIAAILNLNTGDLVADFFAVAPTNSSTILLPVMASTIGITPASPRLTYSVMAFDLSSDDSDAFEAAASFNVVHARDQQRRLRRRGSGRVRQRGCHAQPG